MNILQFDKINVVVTFNQLHTLTQNEESAIDSSNPIYPYDPLTLEFFLRVVRRDVGSVLVASVSTLRSHPLYLPNTPLLTSHPSRVSLLWKQLVWT